MKLDMNNVKAFLSKNKSYIIIAVIFVVMIFTIVKVTSGNEDKAKEADSSAVDQEEVITIDETTTADEAAEPEPEPNDLKVDAYPEVNELVNKYFTAMAESDIDTIKQIVTPLTEEEQAQITQKKEYIEGYDNIVCYSKIGPEENSYIVFVYYEIKFINIETLVPGEIPLYICTNEDGNLYIYNGELSPEVDSYIANIAAGEDVAALIESVDVKFKEAQEADPDLKEFITKLSGNAEDATDVADNSEEEQPENASPEGEKQPEEEPEAKPEENTEDKKEEENTSSEDKIEEVSDTIFATATVNIRDTNSEDGSKLGQLYVGESAKRTGICSNGWSRIDYNGKTGYILTEYVTNQGFTEETMYLTSTVNIRAEADETSDKLGTGFLGSKVTRTTKLDNGWSRINCDGIIGYVKSEFLSDTYE